MTADELVDRIERAIREYAEPARAPQMQAYMKSTIPYAGTPVPIVRKLTHAEAHVADRATLTAAVEQLWDDATVREERYAATALLSLPPVRADITLLPLVERMIVEGAWWDHVDELSHRIGELLSAHRTQMTSVLRTWSTDENIWRRRSAIISQLDARAETDLDLLTAAIEASVPGGPLTGPTASHRARVFPAQGNRLGVASVRPDRRRVGATVCRRSHCGAEPAVPARSDEASERAHALNSSG